jgi:outer membrane murein-binding lipoprotein Lpp
MLYVDKLNKSSDSLILKLA